MLLPCYVENLSNLKTNVNEYWRRATHRILLSLINDFVVWRRNRELHRKDSALPYSHPVEFVYKPRLLVLCREVMDAEDAVEVVFPVDCHRASVFLLWLRLAAGLEYPAEEPVHCPDSKQDKPYDAERPENGDKDTLLRGELKHAIAHCSLGGIPILPDHEEIEREEDNKSHRVD